MLRSDISDSYLEAEMVPHDAAADEILRKVVSFVKKGDGSHLRILDAFPVAMYLTDASGLITYFNPACIDFAGRTPEVLRDRWCVTWKLYTNDGEFLPHNQCPMAVAIQTRQTVRGITAVAERPDGTRIKFVPFPTPVIGESGELLSAVNMLIDITESNEASSQEIQQGAKILQENLVKEALSTFSVEDIRSLLEEIDMQMDRQPPRTLN
jgi:PAS domain S-box-containing protein